MVVGKEDPVFGVYVLFAIESDPLSVSGSELTDNPTVFVFGIGFERDKPLWILQSFLKLFSSLVVQYSQIPFKSVVIPHFIRQNTVLRIIHVRSPVSLKCCCTDQNPC